MKHFSKYSSTMSSLLFWATHAGRNDTGKKINTWNKIKCIHIYKGFERQVFGGAVSFHPDEAGGVQLALVRSSLQVPGGSCSHRTHLPPSSGRTRTPAAAGAWGRERSCVHHVPGVHNHYLRFNWRVVFSLYLTLEMLRGWAHSLVCAFLIRNQIFFLLSAVFFDLWSRQVPNVTGTSSAWRRSGWKLMWCWPLTLPCLCSGKRKRDPFRFVFSLPGK